MNNSRTFSFRCWTSKVTISVVTFRYWFKMKRCLPSRRVPCCRAAAAAVFCLSKGEHGVNMCQLHDYLVLYLTVFRAENISWLKLWGSAPPPPPQLQSPGSTCGRTRLPLLEKNQILCSSYDTQTDDFKSVWRRLSEGFCVSVHLTCVPFWWMLHVIRFFVVFRV